MHYLTKMPLFFESSNSFFKKINDNQEQDVLDAQQVTYLKTLKYGNFFRHLFILTGVFFSLCSAF